MPGDDKKKNQPSLPDDATDENELEEPGEEELESCDPEEGCEEETEASGKGKKGTKPERATGKGKDTKPATPAKPPAPAQAASTRYRYPFNIRYAAEILDLVGFVDDQEYTDAQIRELLIQNGYTEFADVEPAFHLSSATNTLVITIKGSKKGGAGDGP